MEQQEEKKLVTAYVVKRYENGDVDVEDAHLEGTTELNSEAMYKDIEDVAKIIGLKRTENAAYAGVYRFYADLERRAAEQAQAAQQADAPVADEPSKK